ncbi:hypothetical protein ANCDUO_23001 [Ancylostoma duodenale]|uniref:EGF-like domain-containing protein n=1 Tax=Ancylostoma duodenale TaxID=51022 RepID=A0A0C2FJL7_9BILA|nr:hypothetical protein ANCDUO_23001 [Ancylostoma duodenale]
MRVAFKAGQAPVVDITVAMVQRKSISGDKCNPNTSAKCENGGFPHPRRCNECICPGGYGGTLCNQRPKDCEHGETLEASNGWNSLTAMVQKKNNDGSYVTCTYWITAPDDKKIEIEIESINTKETTVGCAKGGVEIKANANHTVTGYRCDDTEDTYNFPRRTRGTVLLLLL